jgi:hypothetical protein
MPEMNQTRPIADLTLDIRNSVAYVQVARVSWFGLTSAWSSPSQHISYPVPVIPTASVKRVFFGSALVSGTASVIFELDASQVRLQLVRAVAVVTLPGGGACASFDSASLGDARCVQKRTVICTEDGLNRTCETILHCNIEPFIDATCASSGAAVSYWGLSHPESMQPSAYLYLPLSFLSVGDANVTVFLVSINSFATSAPSSGVAVRLPCDPPADVSVVSIANGANVTFVSVPPCRYVLRLWTISSSERVSMLRQLDNPEPPVLLRLLPLGEGLAVTLSSVDSRGVEGLSSPPVPFVLPPDKPVGVQAEGQFPGEVQVIWSQPSSPVSDSLPYSGYASTPLSDISAAFSASRFGSAAGSQRLIVASLVAGAVVHSVNLSLSAGALLLPPSLRSLGIVYAARVSFGVRSEWVSVILNSGAGGGDDGSSVASNTQRVWCVLRTEGSSSSASGVGGVFISSNGFGSVLVAATRCDIGPAANLSIESGSDGKPVEQLQLRDDSKGHASAVVSVSSWPHPNNAIGRKVTVLAQNQPPSSCQLSADVSPSTSPSVFECSPCTTLGLPGDTASSIGYRYQAHWTVILALNTELQPSHDVLGKAIRIAHQ